MIKNFILNSNNTKVIDDYIYVEMLKSNRTFDFYKILTSDQEVIKFLIDNKSIRQHYDDLFRDVLNSKLDNIHTIHKYILEELVKVWDSDDRYEHPIYKTGFDFKILSCRCVTKELAKKFYRVGDYLDSVWLTDGFLERNELGVLEEIYQTINDDFCNPNAVEKAISKRIVDITEIPEILVNIFYWQNRHQPISFLDALKNQLYRLQDSKLIVQIAKLFVTHDDFDKYSSDMDILDVYYEIEETIMDKVNQEDLDRIKSYFIIAR